MINAKGTLSKWIVVFASVLLLTAWVFLHNATEPIQQEKFTWEGNPSILLLGATSFLGKHLADTFINKGFVTQLADRVPYTESVAGHIQRTRATHLKETLGAHVTVGDTCGSTDNRFLSSLLEDRHFTHIVLVATNERSEFSVATNIQRQVNCIQHVLEEVVKRPSVRLVIVSSMAMGMSAERDAEASALIEMYSGLAFAYHEEYGMKVALIHTTAELFGAWEHPKMPLSTWAKALDQRIETLSEVTGHGMLYVGDAANEISMCINLSRDWDVWEVRAGAETYTDVWETLQHYGQPEVENVNKDRIVAKLHLLPHSFVENSHARMVSGNSPPRSISAARRTPLSQTVGEFVEWHDLYISDGYPEDAVDLLSMFSDHIWLSNKRVLGIQLDLRNRWVDFARTANLQLPPTAGPHNYSFFQGATSVHEKFFMGKLNTRPVPALKEVCDSQPLCVGFDTDGNLFSGIMPQTHWQKIAKMSKEAQDPSAGLYLSAGVDLCSHPSLHKCMENGYCTMDWEGVYHCECIPGFTLTRKGSMCADLVRFPNLAHQPISLNERQRTLTGNKHKPGAPPRLRLPGKQKISGFGPANDNQVFIGKGVIHDYAENLVEEQPYLLAPPPDMKSVISQQTQIESRVNVVVCTDTTQAEGLPTMINSAHTNFVGKELHVYVVTEQAEVMNVVEMLRCRGLDAIDHHSAQSHNAESKHWIDVIGFDVHIVEGMYKVYTAQNTVGNLSSALNYARFYLAKLLPNDVKRVIYLDVDIIVQGNLADLEQQSSVAFETDDELVVMAAPRNPSKMSKAAHSAYKSHTGSDFDEKHMVQYNAGVFVVDLKRWMAYEMTREAEFWMTETKRSKLWDYGSQPVMWMTTMGRTGTIDRKWNLDGLGWAKVGQNIIVTASILHWSGKNKPWSVNNRYRAYWTPYTPIDVCSNGQLPEDHPFAVNDKDLQKDESEDENRDVDVGGWAEDKNENFKNQERLAEEVGEKQVQHGDKEHAEDEALMRELKGESIDDANLGAVHDNIADEEIAMQNALEDALENAMKNDGSATENEDLAEDVDEAIGVGVAPAPNHIVKVARDGGVTVHQADRNHLEDKPKSDRNHLEDMLKLDLGLNNRFSEGMKDVDNDDVVVGEQVGEAVGMGVDVDVGDAQLNAQEAMERSVERALSEGDADVPEGDADVPEGDADVPEGDADVPEGADIEYDGQIQENADELDA
eukprot:CFRG7879T1